MKKIYMVVTVMIIGTIVGIGYYWQLIQSPQYSLCQAQKAIKNHDIEAFEKYVDVEKLSEQLLEQLVEQTDDSAYRAAFFFFQSQLLKFTKDKILSHVEGTNLTEKRFGQTSLDNYVFELSRTIEIIMNKAKDNELKIIEIKTEGKTATVKLEPFYEKYGRLDYKFALSIKMRKKDRYWQIVGLNMNRKMEFVEEKW